ncbi:MAG: hypothetical protein RMJ19_13595, partial [Gemmatales bacterium]|nr:hypothetical protein [Gemmatales bacterium]MDW8176704.1 hypothetical protein [Gemmatales bacterium]
MTREQAPISGGGPESKVAVAPRLERPTTWEEVRKRNYVERIKLEKFPYDLAAEFEQLAATPYEAIPEEDMLLFQWWGLYH